MIFLKYLRDIITIFSKYIKFFKGHFFKEKPQINCSSQLHSMIGIDDLMEKCFCDLFNFQMVFVLEILIERINAVYFAVILDYNMRLSLRILDDSNECVQLLFYCAANST